MSKYIVIKYGLIITGVFASALAQIMLKKASCIEIRSLTWMLYIGISALSYGLAFISYAIVLKYVAISRLSPIMTISVMILVVLFGFSLGERYSFRQYLGLALGILSIALILPD